MTCGSALEALAHSSILSNTKGRTPVATPICKNCPPRACQRPICRMSFAISLLLMLYPIMSPECSSFCWKLRVTPVSTRLFRAMREDHFMRPRPKRAGTQICRRIVSHTKYNCSRVQAAEQRARRKTILNTLSLQHQVRRACTRPQKHASKGSSDALGSTVPCIRVISSFAIYTRYSSFGSHLLSTCSNSICYI